MKTEALTLLLAVAFSVAGMIAFARSRRPRRPTTAPTPPASGDELQSFVRELVSEIEHAIALCSLSRGFSYDERIDDTYDNTFEARGFVMCRSSVDSALAMTIMRCHDHRHDSHGLSAFFTLLDDETATANLRESILIRRRKWAADETEAQRESDEHMQQIANAGEEAIALRASHQFDRVRNFRHTQVAHNARSRGWVAPVQREYLYDLTDRSKDLVQVLSGAVLGEGQSFGTLAAIWEDTYARTFFDTLFERAGD